MKTVAKKKRYPREAAIAVARELVGQLAPVTERLVVAGSLRRGKAEVGDVEILFIPRREERQVDLFNVGPIDLAEEKIAMVLRYGDLAKRRTARGSVTWGERNKLAVHCASGIPVDLFAATEANWWNYLVCRTGPAELNRRICSAAIARGWKWNPYGSGFTRPDGSSEVAMTSEQEVFEFVGLEYKPPHLRR